MVISPTAVVPKSNMKPSLIALNQNTCYMKQLVNHIKYILNMNWGEKNRVLVVGF